MLNDGENRDVRRIQAQLRWLFLNKQDEGYSDPGPLDGELGPKAPLPSFDDVTKPRKAIYNFRKKHEKLVSPDSEPEKKPANYEIDGLEDILNRADVAPIAKPK